MLDMLDILNKKLAEARDGKKKAQEQIALLAKQREQAIANLNAFVGAEQAVLQLIEETEKLKGEEVTADENVQD